MRIVRDITDNLREVLAECKELTDENRKSIQDSIKILECVEDYELLENRVAITSAVFGYYAGTRSVGHTRVLRQGIEKANEKEFSDFKSRLIVVVDTDKQRQNFQDFEVVTLQDIKEGKLRSRQLPLAWDNSAIIRLVSLMQIVGGTFKRVRHIVEETVGNNNE